MGNLYIVTGSNGALGRAYLDKLIAHGENTIAVARGSHRFDWPKMEVLDLIDVDACNNFVDELALDGISKIILIHCVGTFHVDFEPPSLEIVNKVVASNFGTFQNIAVPLLRKASECGVSVRLVAFGSPSDTNPPRVDLWKTFTMAKNAIRKMIQKLSHPHSGLMVNISSTKTENEQKLRPFADVSFWLKPEEVVGESFLKISQGSDEIFQEIKVIKPQPGFGEDYYNDPSRIVRKWTDEMFGKKGG